MNFKINEEVIKNKLENGIFYQKYSTNFDELDPLNMLHNSRYSYIIERATYLFFNAVSVIEKFDIVEFPDLHHVVRQINLTYIKPIFGVISFFVKVRPIKLREAACIYEVSFVSEDKNVVYCKGERTIVKVNPLTFQPAGWSKKFRETHEFIIGLSK